MGSPVKAEGRARIGVAGTTAIHTSRDQWQTRTQRRDGVPTLLEMSRAGVQAKGGLTQMFRQVGIGAAAVLSIGLLAAGCSEDGDNIIAGGNGSLLPGNTDQSPFAGFESNNLSPDGGAFSENGASVDQV